MLAERGRLPRQGRRHPRGLGRRSGSRSPPASSGGSKGHERRADAARSRPRPAGPSGAPAGAPVGACPPAWCWPARSPCSPARGSPPGCSASCRPPSVTTLRLWSAALIMLVVAGRGAARAVAGLAARRAWTDGVTTLTFGIALGFMNFAIYQAFARIPLGIAVTIEFLGPLAVTVTGTLRGSRHRRAAGLGYAALAAAGRAAARGHGSAGTRLNWAGVAWAAAAGSAWAAYILGSARPPGQRLPGASGLVIAMCVAARARSPGPGLAAGAPAMFRPSLLAVGRRASGCCRRSSPTGWSLRRCGGSRPACSASGCRCSPPWPR